MCDTLQRNKRGLPGAVTQGQVHKGQYIYRWRGDIMVLKFHDKRHVLMIAFMHKADMVDTGKKDRQTWLTPGRKTGMGQP